MAKIPFLAQEFVPFPSAPQIYLYIFGPGENERDWNLGDLWRGNGFSRRPALQELLLLLETIAQNADFTDLLVPSVSEFNALVSSAAGLVAKVNSPNKVVRIHGGVAVDGVIVPPGYASWQQSADCWTICARNAGNKRTGTARAGFKSLYDLPFLKFGKRSRPNFSVTDALLERIGGDHAQTEVFIAGGIGQEHYGHPRRHPTYGADNVELFKYCTWLGKKTCAYRGGNEFKFNIPEIIRAQLVQKDVPTGNIRISCTDEGTVTDTYSDTDENGRFLWHSARRNGTLKRNAGLLVNSALETTT